MKVGAARGSIAEPRRVGKLKLATTAAHRQNVKMDRVPLCCRLALLAGFIPALCWLMADTPPALSPAESLKRFKVADGFQVKLVASEPLIRQPVTMTFDDRGRLWVIQYLQYPTPAGLKAVQVDQYLRTKYDRLPEPPPRGPKGADRITILEDPDGDGRYDKAKDFVTGLNLASGMALGHGGVFVAQPPYLLFYADRNGDDMPDRDPEVLLTGFGMEDAHAFPNSLQWGPDGWLYGAQGSTVTANIRGIEFQQGIWRYRPPLTLPSPPGRRGVGGEGGMAGGEFELFAEGGGNTWGVDFDRHGQLIAGTNFGGFVLLHQVQGAYYVKGFAKHGPLHNPHAYGYFDHAPCQGFKGGHVTCGGIVYQGDLFPEKYQHKYIAANLLSNAVFWHHIEPKGSSFTTRFGGELLTTDDPWFRPVDCLTGPDGAVYIADWYDKRATHLDPIDNWDRTSGRIYKIEPKASDWATDGRARLLPSLTRQPAESRFRISLRKLSSEQLIEFLAHRNNWQRRLARHILAERRDAEIVPALRKQVLENHGQLALESLWALYVSGGFDDDSAGKLLAHADEHIRAWTIRLLGDVKKVAPDIRDRLVRLARTEPSCVVRNQLACTCKRLPAKDALRIVRGLLARREDVDDPQIPLLLWWAIEDKLASDRPQVLDLLDSSEVWAWPMVQQHIVERLARRYMAEATDSGYAACALLLERAPDSDAVRRLVGGMDRALEGSHLPRVPAALEKRFAELWSKDPESLPVLRLALRLGHQPARTRAVEFVSGAKQLPQPNRISLIEVLGQAGDSRVAPVLVKLVTGADPVPVRLAALSALQAFTDPSIAESILTHYTNLPSALKDRAQALLFSRPASSLALLQAVDRGVIPAKEVPVDQVRGALAHQRVEIDRLVEKHWGKLGPATQGEKLARMRYLAHAVRTGKGNSAAGKPLFQKHCGNCHVLFGEGSKIGPDLTGADRKNLDLLLTQVIDPSAAIRPEHFAHTIATTDGRLLTGLVVESAAGAITLVDAKAEKTVVAREQIDAMKPSPVSLMPEKLLDALSDQEVRDLFSYLQGDEPKGASKR